MPTPVDGRTTRWARHNAERRGELVESSLRAIRRQGHGIGMDELAAEAGNSKTVLYRHFGDESVHAFILGNLSAPLASGLAPDALVTELADAYLAVVEADGEIYPFVSNRPAGTTDPVLGITNRIGDEVAGAFGHWLREHGLDDAPAMTWGHGVVGFTWAVADRWILTDLRRPRADIVTFVGRLFAPAFAAQTQAARATT